jgi:tetratricopeptide (TPR) repeat protein
MPRPFSGGRVRAFATMTLAILSSAPGWAAESVTEAEERALTLVYENRCDEALAEIEAARRERDSALMALVDGTCRIRLRDFAAAASALDEARRLDPDLEDVDTYRGIALYQLGEYDAARRAFGAASGNTSSKVSAQREFYTGMLLLQDRQDRKAAEALDRSRVMDAGQVEPAASFYAGLAWLAAGEREPAREAMKRVVAADPEGPWGKRAHEVLEGQSFEDRSWASLMVGLEYDSNVVLLGEAVPLPQGISNQSDGRVVWYAEGGAELFRKNKWSGGLGASYAGNVQFNLHEFDIQYPRGNGWIDFEVDQDHLIRFRYGIGYAWVDYSPFLFTQDASASLYRDWGDRGNTELGLGWLWNDYQYFIRQVPNGTGTPGALCPGGGPSPCAPPGVDSQAARNRDGNALKPFFIHRYRVRSIDYESFRDVELRGGYGFERYWAEGSDWDYSSHDFIVGAKALLFWNIRAESQVSFSYRPYSNISSFPNEARLGREYALLTVPREDEIVSVAAHFEKQISDHLSVSALYSYTRAISNVTSFDYSRHIVGGYVKYRF